MINLSDQLTAKTVENILGQSSEIAYIYGDAGKRTTHTVANVLNVLTDEMVLRVKLGQQVGELDGVVWEPSTEQEYIDHQFELLIAEIDRKMQAQQDKLNTLNGNEVVVGYSLPSKGEVGIIYRVSSGATYSDYMWDVNQATPGFVPIATYAFPGTEHNPTDGSLKLVTSDGIYDALGEKATIGDIVIGDAPDWTVPEVQNVINEGMNQINEEMQKRLADQDQKIDVMNGNQVILKASTGQFPTTGDPTVIYRVSGDTSYTDYMWNTNVNPAAYTKIATYSFPGIDTFPQKNSNNLVTSSGIYSALTEFDVSAYHNGATYSGLTSALNAVPAEFRKPGLTVKWVRTSDNKYVHNFNTSSAWTVTESAWVGMTDGIWDVTTNNGGATFASLQALLSDVNLNTLIPNYARHGGMSIKFVQSSDNKYVQYMYLGTAITGTPNPFLDTANWQGVDAKPTQMSKNLVESGGVLLNQWNTLEIPIKVSVVIVNNAWKIQSNVLSYIIPCREGQNLYIKANANYNAKYAFLTDKNIEDGVTPNYATGTQLNNVSTARFVNVVIPQETKYLLVFVNSPSLTKPESITIDGLDAFEYISSLEQGIVDVEKKFDDLLPTNERRIIVGTLEADGSWIITDNQVSKYILVKVTPSTSCQIQANNEYVICAFLKNVPKTFYNGLSLLDYYATGTGRLVWLPSSPATTTPADAEYMLLSMVVRGVDFSPKLVKVGQVDYTKSIQQNINDINNKIDVVKSDVTKLSHLIVASRFTLDELYLSKEFYTNADIASIVSWNFYMNYHSTQYIVGIIFRDSSSNIVVDGRLYFNTSDEALAVLNRGFIDTPSFKYKFTVTNYEATTLSGTIQLTTDVFDVTKQESINLEMLNGSIYDECKVTPTITTGKYINLSGVIADLAVMGYTSDISLKAGETIKLYCSGYTNAAALSIHDGNSYTPLMAGISNSFDSYHYTAPVDCNIVACLRHASYYAISVVKKADNSLITVMPSLVWKNKCYIIYTTEGNIVGSNDSGYGVSNAIKVYKGDLVKVKMAGSANVSAVISKTDKNLSIIKPVTLCTSDSYTEYSYVVDETGYIVLSGKFNTETAPSLIIQRIAEYQEFDEVDNTVFNEKNAVENRYYVDDVESIPENYGTILTYDGDNKVDTGHIVNAVSYPNGEIIACRENGEVVKIGLDGTETVLLTLVGYKMDWRGMYIDSNNNVYVSPHATMGGMNMTGRGLYRIPYNSNVVTKVIALYNPQSSIPTEAEANDDTIWTMCEDNNGNLYAGVYAHSTRPNPSIYKSSDNGVTWSIVTDFLTNGAVQSSTQFGYDNVRHIHCVIFNKYDHALYCLVGEINTIFKSTDGGNTWIDMEVRTAVAKGTCLIDTPNGILLGSDGAYTGSITKAYSDGKTTKQVGRMWHAEFFGFRRSDVTDWIYAFTKIESNIGRELKYPPIAANSSEEELNTWKNDTVNHQVPSWERYNEWVSEHYAHDAIHPVNAAILVSKDNGETWEVIYKKDTNGGSGVGMGIFCVGYFRNGECLCGMAIEEGGTKKFSNPIIISEGRHRFTTDGIDLSDEIFIKTNTTNYIV